MEIVPQRDEPDLRRAELSGPRAFFNSAARGAEAPVYVYEAAPPVRLHYTVPADPSPTKRPPAFPVQASKRPLPKDGPFLYVTKLRSREHTIKNRLERYVTR